MSLRLISGSWPKVAISLGNTDLAGCVEPRVVDQRAAKCRAAGHMRLAGRRLRTTALAASSGDERVVKYRSAMLCKNSVCLLVT